MFLENNEEIKAGLAFGIFLLCFIIEIFLFTLIQYYFQILAGWEFSVTGEITTYGGIWGIWVGLMITEAITVAIVILILYFRRKKLASLIKTNEKVIHYTLIGIPLILIAAFGAGYLQLFIMNIFNIQLPASTEALSQFLTPKNIFELIIWITIMFLIVAPAEEIFARACIQEGFQNSLNKRNNGIFYSIIISSFCFTIFHLDPFRFFPVFCESLVLGYIYYKSESVIPTILIHGASNSILLILAMFGI